MFATYFSAAYFQCFELAPISNKPIPKNLTTIGFDKVYEDLFKKGRHKTALGYFIIMYPYYWKNAQTKYKSGRSQNNQ